MSPPGTTRTCRHVRPMSVIGVIADDMCSLRVFRSLTQTGHTLHLAKDARLEQSSET
jgi:hypothetical protein